MTSELQSEHMLDLHLSDEEIFYVGMIVAHWGTLEHTIFIQTIMSFNEPDGQIIELPKSMNNIKFTDTLLLWKERVANKSSTEIVSTLQHAYDEILSLKDYRDAITHGMWEWQSRNLDEINTVRIKKREIITTIFRSEDLRDFAFRVAHLNFTIRYPRGIADLAVEREGYSGFHISRKALRKISESRDSGQLPGP